MPVGLWTLENVSLPGYGERSRLAEISLTIGTGVTVILGYSGAGKTSLLNVLVDFEKPRGAVTFRRPMGFKLPLYWSPADHGLWPFMTVRGHLLAVVPDSTEEKERVERLLTDLELSSLENRYPHDLSLGERARLSVGRALAARPGVLVLDEPLDHVDPARLPRFWEVVRREIRECNASLVFTTHSPETALRMAEQAICLHDGRVLWTGAIRELYESPPSADLGAYLGALNWFSSEERAAWGLAGDAKRAIRPERIEIVPAEDGLAAVESGRFLGSHGETTLVHQETNERRTVFARSLPAKLEPGDRVMLRLCSVVWLMLSIALSGCGDASGTKLEFESTRTLKMPLEPSRFPAPRGMVYGPKDELLVLDDIGRVIRYLPDGKVDKVWWMPDYKVGRPEGIRVLLDGRMAVADTHYHRIVLFNHEGEFVGTIGQRGTELGDFEFPVGVTQDPQGFIYVADYGGTDRITKFTADGKPVLMFGGLGSEPGEMQRPSGVAWHDGQVYVADAINNRVQQFTDEGKFVRVLADSSKADLHYPYNVMMGPDNNLYVVEYGGCRVTKLDLEGKVLGRYGKEGRSNGEFWTPWGLAVDSKGKIAVADTGNRRIVELTP
jgi:iron(III) transport system ATP-binding protein